MKKYWFTCLAAAMCGILMMTAACADTVTLSGTVAPAETVQVYAPISGTAETVSAEAGQKVEAGQVLYTMKTGKVYAESDGTVTGIFGQPGDPAETVSTKYGAVLYLEETNVYTVSASTDHAYSTVETKFVHAGETVYLQCRSNTERKGKGVITAISGNSYTVEVTEGVFIPGDSVEIYRDADYTYNLKIGRGSVSRKAPTAVTATGSIVRIAVEDGAQVKRGDLLMETLEGTFDGYRMTGTEITAGTAGIIGNISVSPGSTVQKDSVAAEIYPLAVMRVEATVTEDTRGRIREGDQVRIELETDESKTYPGTVVLVSAIAEEGSEETSYRVAAEFTPDDAVCFGMSAVIVIGEDEEPEPEPEEEAGAAAEGEAPEEKAGERTRQRKERPERPGDGERPEMPEGGDPDTGGTQETETQETETPEQ